MPKKASTVSSSVLEDEKTQYSSLEPREHCIARPGMYIGSIYPSKIEFYSVNNEKDSMKDSLKIIKTERIINQGLHRIFLEILSNAIDNVTRSKNSSTPCTKIKVDIDRETGLISVFNDGKTIPIEINEETGVYNPEMLFGKLMSGSNFNDNEERKTSGLHGLGSVLCNIFSSSFVFGIFDNLTLRFV